MGKVDESKVKLALRKVGTVALVPQEWAFVGNDNVTEAATL